MTLLPNEKMILRSDKDNLVLTTHRVRLEIRTASITRVTSIMLEKLTTCEITSVSKPWLLGLAFLAVVGGFALTNSRDWSSVVLGGILAVALVVIYFATRRGVIALRSAGGVIMAPTKGMSTEAAKAFIDAVETAKNNRYLSHSEAAAA